MKSILFTKIRFLAHKLVSSWQINEGAACMSIYIMNPTTVTISFPFLPPPFVPSSPSLNMLPRQTVPVSLVLFLVFLLHLTLLAGVCDLCHITKSTFTVDVGKVRKYGDREIFGGLLHDTLH